MIHIADERLVVLVMLGKKTTHRFPAQYKPISGEITSPKIAVGKKHFIYTEAPFGSYGDPRKEPLARVIITSVFSQPLCDITEEDVREEGFASVAAFTTYWNRVWFNRALKAQNHPYHPTWVIRFKLDEVLPKGNKLLLDFKKKREKPSDLPPSE